MAKYVVEIDYTDNTDKTAKIKIIDNNEKVVLKSDVILPNWMHERSDYMCQLEVQKFINTDYSSENYSVDVKKMSELHRVVGNSYIQNKANYMGRDIKIIKKDDFYSASEKKIKGDYNVMTLPTHFFDALKSIILDEQNTVTIDATKKWFVFGQKPCDRDFDSACEQYLSLGKDIEATEILLKRRKEVEAFHKYNAEFEAMLNKYPAKHLSSNQSSNANRVQLQPTNPTHNGVKKVVTKYRNESNHSSQSTPNPHEHFQQIYQSTAQQHMYDLSSHSCRSSSSSNRHENSSNDYCSSGSSPSFD